MKSKRLVKINLMDLFHESDESKKYHFALGRFINYYSVVEQMLIIILHHYSKTELPIAKALFSNWRPDTSINALHKIIKVRQLKGQKIKELQHILAQISVITKVRNDLVHIGPHFGGIDEKKDKRFISNAFLAYSRNVVRKTPISAEILDAMYGDLFEISMRFASHLISARPRLKAIKISDITKPGFFPEGKAGAARFALVVTKLFRQAFPASRLPAWRYKQPSTKKHRRKSRARHQAHASQPSTSSR